MHKMKAFLIASLLVAGSLGLAQTTTAATPTANMSTTAVPETKPRSILDSVVLGYKSYNDTGRFGFKDQDVSKDAYKGRTYKGKHEAKLGYKHSSGWGVYGQMTQYRYDYSANPSSNSKWSAADPSITLMHPTIYDNGVLKLTGYARYYVPNTDRSKTFGVRQAAYYSDIVYKLAQDQEIFNEINPRIFVQDTYGATDARVKIEDITSYTRKIAPWGRWGVAQWTQFEQHAEAPNGLTVDVYPFFDYMVNQKIFLGPRLYMPVMVQNYVYDGSRAATWENAYWELYFQASL